MLSQNKISRLAAWIAVAGLVLSPTVPLHAQGAPAADQGPEVNPPGRVGRLAWTQGSVSFHASDQDSWSPAVVNYPVTSGMAFWTQPRAQAGIQVSNTLLAMDQTTELDVNTLDDTNLIATEPQGEVYLHVRDLVQGENYTLETPRGTVAIATPGIYEITAGTTQTPTLITVIEGAAQVIPGGQGTQPLNVPAGQTAAITGDQTFQAQLEPAVHDAFLDAMLQREQRVPAQPPAAPPVVAQMPGGADLAEYGSWSESPQYGNVWYPQVASGWVPYREGYWSYVAPWGWTWIDNDPWGFAPFHYGRWVDFDGRWGWCPGFAVAGAVPYPVYAPALVSFFDIGAAAAIGVGVGLAAGVLLSGSIGWVPLGWNEPWHPWFRTSPAYFRQVNIHNVTNITNISNTTINNITVNNFRNARAATVVPAADMVTSRPLRGVAQPARPEQLAAARPVFGRAPIAPTTATLGVTPALARQQHIAALPAGMAAPVRPAAPGPAIRPETLAAARPGTRPPVPTLRGPTTPVAAGVAGVPHAPTAGAPGVAPGGRPGTATPQHGPAITEHAMPALRAPEAGRAGPPPIGNEAGRTAVTTAPPRLPQGVTGPHAPTAGAPGVAPGGRPGTATPLHGPAITEHAMPALRAPEAGRAGPPPIGNEAGRTAVATAPPRLPQGVTGPQTATQHVVPPQERLTAPVAPRPATPQGVTHGAPVAARPAAPPVVHEPTRPAVVRPEAPVVHQPERQAVVRPTAPPVVHEAPRQPVMPRVEAPRPAPAPRPEFNAATRPMPAPAPRPEMRVEAPRPAPMPMVRPAPAPMPMARPAPEARPAPQQRQEKRPGQP